MKETLRTLVPLLLGAAVGAVVATLVKRARPWERHRTHAVVAALALALTGCATAKPRTDWGTGEAHMHFTASPLRMVNPGRATFTVRLTGNLHGWCPDGIRWDFGDGSSFSQAECGERAWSITWPYKSCGEKVTSAVLLWGGKSFMAAPTLTIGICSEDTW